MEVLRVSGGLVLGGKCHDVCVLCMSRLYILTLAVISSDQRTILITISLHAKGQVTVTLCHAIERESIHSHEGGRALTG